MWSIGHLKILSPEIQKIVMVSNFWVILGSHISGTGGQKNFFAKWCFSDKSNIIPQTEENLRQSVYKSFSFAWFLQTVALRIKLLKIVLILSGDRSLSSLFFSCFLDFAPWLNSTLWTLPISICFINSFYEITLCRTWRLIVLLAQGKTVAWIKNSGW